MKKVLFFTLVFTAIVGVISSCSQIDDAVIDPAPASRSHAQLTTVAPDTSSVITPTRAMSIAAYLSQTNLASRATSHVAESVDAVTDEDGNPLMYVVNYTNDQGFVILSALTSYLPILAQSDEGRFDLANLDSSHPVNLWLDEQKYLIKHADALPDSIKKRADSEWMSFNFDHVAVAADDNVLDKPQVYYDSLRRWTIDPNVEVYKYEDYIQTAEYQNLTAEEKHQILQGIWSVGNSNYGSVESSTLVLRTRTHVSWQHHWMQSTWAQQSGFNKYFDIYLPGQPYAAGCANVALGQIMYYHRYPSTFNWSGMSDHEYTDVTAQFLYDLSKATKSQKGSEGDTQTEIGDVRSALEKYGYTVSKFTHNTTVAYAQKIITSLLKGNPVFMRGKRKTDNGNKAAHAWVCDGAYESYNIYEVRFMTIEYRPTTTYEPPLMVEGAKRTWVDDYSTPRFHMNWGYSGKYDAYFYDTNIGFTTTSGEFRDYKYERKDLIITPGK